jgi:hypothetical protein
MIHPSHSKKELCEVIEDYREIPKLPLSKALWAVLIDKKTIKREEEHFCVDDIHELREYLRKPSARNQITSDAVKYDVLDRVKKLIFYCKVGYIVIGTEYKNLDEVIADAVFVENFGDLPSVRRGLRLLNGDVKMPRKFEPNMTPRVKKREERLKQLKAHNTMKLRISRETVVLIFA